MKKKAAFKTLKFKNQETKTHYNFLKLDST